MATNRYTATSAPTLGTVVRNVAAVTPEPWAASGTQKCIGTPPALNSSPASTPRMPVPTAASGAVGNASRSRA